MTVTEVEHDRRSQQSVDLWKYFEDRGSKLKESMFTQVTWMIGLASAVLAFAVKEGFAAGSALTLSTQPVPVIGLSLAGLLIIQYGQVTVRDYGEHINRTFDRANAARAGAYSPEVIWQAGDDASGRPLPLVCAPILKVLRLFSYAFYALIVLAGASLVP